MCDFQAVTSFGELLAKAKGIKEADVAKEASQVVKKERVEKVKRKPKEVKVKKELVRKAKAKAKAKVKVKKEKGKEKVPMVKKVRAALKRRSYRCSKRERCWQEG